MKFFFTKFFKKKLNLSKIHFIKEIFTFRKFFKIIFSKSNSKALKILTFSINFTYKIPHLQKFKLLSSLIKFWNFLL